MGRRVPQPASRRPLGGDVIEDVYGDSMKKIGFLSFGHWSEAPPSQARSASDFLHQSIDLAVAAEELGLDGAYFRVHHFARQAASPFPLLAAIGARTSKIEIGTGVIDMRYENPMYMAEDAGAADLISDGRLQLGISRGSPEQVIEGWRYFGFAPSRGRDRRGHGPSAHRGVLEGDRGRRLRPAEPAADVPEPAWALAAGAVLGGPARADLVGFELDRDERLGGEARYEPPELDAKDRRDRRAAPRPAAQADRGFPRRPGRRPGMSASPGFR